MVNNQMYMSGTGSNSFKCKQLLAAHFNTLIFYIPQKSLIYATCEFCGVVTKGIYDSGDNKSIASLWLPGLSVPSVFAYCLHSVFLNTPYWTLTESSLIHIKKKSLLRPTQAK